MNNNVLIDYLSISIPTEDFEERTMNERYPGFEDLSKNQHLMNLLELFKVDLDKMTDNGKIANYAIWYTFHEHINIKGYGPMNAQERKIHTLELRGSGCREVEKLGVDWDRVFRYLARYELKVSRIDIALDVLNNDYFTMSQLEKKADNQEYTSNLSNYRKIDNKKNNRYNGKSLYFGTRKGTQINIYDKKYERMNHGYKVDTETWIRIELRLRQKKTRRVIELLAARGMENLKKSFFAVLRGFLDFKENSHTRKERANTWEPWARLIEDTPKTTIKNQAELESTIAKKAEHMKRSYGKTLVKVALGEEDIKEFLNQMVNPHIEKLTKKDLEEINNHRKQKGKKPIKDLEQARKILQKEGWTNLYQ